MRDVVLILTHTRDHFTVDRVSAALERRGLRPFRLDTDRFPGSLRLGASMSRDGTSYELDDGARALEVDRVHSVWARRVWPAAIDPGMDPDLREACVRESGATLTGFLDALDVRWVNPLGATPAADNKLRQLRLAREVGLDVPATLVTNDADRVRAFYAARRGAVVVKLQRPLSTSLGKAPLFVRTSDLGAEDLEHLDELRHSPMVFQEKLEKQCELRVACVGERQFAGRIDASGSERGTTDWRAATPDEARWTAGELPADVARGLDALRRRLGLVYGAADLVRTPDGRTVFLEMNSGGEWGMLERDAGLPIADALADELARVEP